VIPLIGADPLLNGDIDTTVILIVIAKTIVLFALLLIGVLFYIWFMRKVIADMQNRIGPASAGPFGILQTLADGIKLFFKEQSEPTTADRPVYLLAPYLSIIPAFLAFAIVPIGGVVSIAGHRTELQLADPAIGILFLLMMSGIGLYGVMLAGWSSGSKYPLIGSVRASAQLLSYEAALGLAVVGVLVHTGTLSTRAIVDQQAWVGADSFFSQWYWAPAIGAFLIFMIAALAETNHPPFDLVEAEQELVGGFNTEYSSIRFALFFLAEFMNVITMSAIFVTLFLGGPSGPAFLGTSLGWLTGIIWFALKTSMFLFMFVWLRATLPRLRYDQLMDLGWKVLIPLALGWLLLLGAIDIGRDAKWNPFAVVGVSVAILLAGYALLRAAVANGKASRLEEVER
jgi:NADH-quinone oxidoreductase subunit H